MKSQEKNGKNGKKMEKMEKNGKCSHFVLFLGKQRSGGANQTVRPE